LAHPKDSQKEAADGTDKPAKSRIVFVEDSFFIR
jgi:hypothetical protein